MCGLGAGDGDGALQAMTVQARLPPSASQQPAAAAGFSAHLGLCMRRLLGRRGRSSSAVTAAGLLGLPAVKRRGRVLCAVVEPSGDESGSDKEDDGKEVSAPSADGSAAAVDSSFKSRRDMLQEYVKNVKPEFMERFVQKAPAQVVEAMRQTVTNMLGTLPPQFFDIHVSTIAENLAQLMCSVMMTGYMFRKFLLFVRGSTLDLHLELKSAVSGDVVRWRKDEDFLATRCHNMLLK